MLTRIHQRLGTAGFVISVVAMVVALSGGAYAASGGLTGKQKKEVEKIAKRVGGKPGAPGAAGPAGTPGSAGAKGDAGAAGTPGAPGKEGSRGPEGSPWTMGGNIPSGTTVSGTWSATAAGEYGGAPVANISFPLTAKEQKIGKAWVFNYFEVLNQEFGKLELEPNRYETCKVEAANPECIDTGCNGNTANPSAPAGTLCAYTLFQLTPPTAEHQELVASYNGEIGEEFSNSYGRSGTAILSKVPGTSPTSQFDAYGIWVLNAP